MTITVTSGHTSSGLTISAGDPLVVLSGGEVEDITILSGGSATLSSGALGNGIAVESGGALLGPGDIEEAGIGGGLISGISVVSQGFVFLDSGSASDVTLTQSSTLADDGGVAIGTLVEDGSRMVVNAAATSGTIGSGSEEEVNGDGRASGDTVQSGGLLKLAPGGTISDETVQSGGTFDFSGELTGNLTLGATTSTTILGGATVSSGGVLEVFLATVRSGATVNMAGTSALAVNVDAGGVLIGPGVLESGGDVAGSIDGLTVAGATEIKAGGSASGLTVVSGPYRLVSLLDVDGGASATNTVVSSACEETVYAGGDASATMVLGSGTEIVFGTTTGTQVNSDGEAFVSSGGVTSETTALNGGVEYVFNDGVAIAATVSSGGREVVRSGGVASQSTVLSGGVEYLWAGTTTGTQVSAGGREIISSGGVASAATVLSGGLEYILAGGVGSGDTVQSGGVLVLESGGAASAAVVEGGEVRVAGGGTLGGTLEGAGAIVQTGAGLLVLNASGADYGGKLAIEGGTVELATAGALGAGYVAFVEPTTGSAVLQIDAADAPAAGATFANSLDNFDDDSEAIDLRGLALVAGATATLAGAVLVLSDGGKTYSFTLAGDTATTYAVASDGHGGTLIDPKATAFAHAAAAFAPAEAAKAALASSTSPIAQTPFAATASSAAHT